VITEFLGETTGSAECPPDTVTKGAIIPFNTHGELLANIMGIFQKCRYKTLPIIRPYPVIAYSHAPYPLSQFFRRL
jgi:hypothetical protein